MRRSAAFRLGLGSGLARRLLSSCKLSCTHLHRRLGLYLPRKCHRVLGMRHLLCVRHLLGMHVTRRHAAAHTSHGPRHHRRRPHRHHHVWRHSRRPLLLLLQLLLLLLMHLLQLLRHHCVGEDHRLRRSGYHGGRRHGCRGNGPIPRSSLWRCCGRRWVRHLCSPGDYWSVGRRSGSRHDLNRSRPAERPPRRPLPAWGGHRRRLLQQRVFLPRLSPVARRDLSYGIF